VPVGDEVSRLILLGGGVTHHHASGLFDDYTALLTCVEAHVIRSLQTIIVLRYIRNNDVVTMLQPAV
jgi:hypothetical protein